jgi:sugar-specific transcriptional regulator TrmB
MDEKIFEKLGLTKGETKVYLALVKLGDSTISPIVTESKVTKSKIYDILEKLIEKGLVGYILKNNVKHFSANDPHMILEYISNKEEELKNIKDEANNLIPQLLLQKKGSSQPIAEIYEGFEGIKAIREELMLSFKENDTFLVLGAPKIANIKWEGWFLDFHKRRINRKVKMRIIYNSDAKEFGKIREKMKLTDVRYLPNELVSPNWTDIFPDAILIIMILKKPIAFVVRDKNLADSYRSYFDILWNVSKK